MRVLGIETTCDETAVAVVDSRKPAGQRILSHHILSQIQQHAPFGGVVPEIAARNHLQALPLLVRKSLQDSGLRLKDLDGISVSAGPGLIGGVLVGSTFAKALCFAARKPFLPVNHLEAHGLCIRLERDLVFPFFLLLLSGGHCQILYVADVGRYRLWGQTIDDALGEAFDKTARLLGLPYPGGPEVERCAQKGNPDRFAFPLPLAGRPHCDFSFSGLKTAVRRVVQTGCRPLSEGDRADICASFQKTVGRILQDRLRSLRKLCAAMPNRPMPLVVAGGVAANMFLRQNLEETAAALGFAPFFTSPLLCTDNGAMVAWAGVENLRKGRAALLDFRPRPRWPLEDLQSEGPPPL